MGIPRHWSWEEFRYKRSGHKVKSQSLTSRSKRDSHRKRLKEKIYAYL